MSELDKILVQQYYRKDCLEKAIKQVKRFIEEKRLIITGGLVIDYFLRLNGDKLYEDYEIPDYDMFSNNNIVVAGELFRRLYNRGFTNISMVQAIHKSTVKIFIFKDCVADITYVDDDLFQFMTKKALDYDGLKFRHPLFQLPDMCRVFMYPYENSPRETINNRWIKDFDRFNHIYKYMNKNKLNPRINDNVFIGNELYSCGEDVAKYYLDKFSIDNDLDPNNKAYIITINELDKFIIDNGAKIKNVTKYKKYLELLPEKTEIEFTDETKIVFYKIMEELSVYPDKKIVTIYFSAIYCFSMFNITGDKKYFKSYKKLLELIYYIHQNEIIEFFPSINTIGRSVHDGTLDIFKIDPVHIKAEDDQKIINSEIAKIKLTFDYPDYTIFNGKQMLD